MKKKIYLIAVTMLLSITAFNSNAATFEGGKDKKDYKEEFAKMTDEQKQARVEEIKTRVEEIKHMDKSHLTRQDKKELRHELRELKHEAQAATSGGVYLSVGAIIIIILVLILIL
ncbi:hypothetical protein [Mucilaginibacter segetis]|uniref:Seryl-tRNA synthetase n=1 Tax=Mucilaginibacter segetis TaxID=2793071 RepID=A0A934PWN4_9SPHI|nr:hypothetical protein [Mucilaginibacter segetis]MBK0380456.1 hypothetical protein [Mucilaginibacter segetis]